GLALGAGRASAQTFDLGVEAGANFSSFIGQDVSSVGGLNASRMGFVGGGFLALNFGPNFALRPEVLFEQKGAAVSGTSTSTELDYIEVPVLLKFGLGTPVINPNILLGPSFAWSTVSKDSNGDFSNINSSDVGLVGGVEIDVDKFLVSGRYELGLDNVQKNVNVQNGTFTLLVGYSFL
ncbi:MAG TPA: porin family protein, partial [bacterium]|nr:porin family protein [bacterium]